MALWNFFSCAENNFFHDFFFLPSAENKFQRSWIFLFKNAKFLFAQKKIITITFIFTKYLYNIYYKNKFQKMDFFFRKMD